MKKRVYSSCYSYVWTLRRTVIVVVDVSDWTIVRFWEKCALCSKMALHEFLVDSSLVLLDETLQYITVGMQHNTEYGLLFAMNNSWVM